MTVTVSVDATWNMTRVEIHAPTSPQGNIVGVGEVLLSEPAEPSPEAGILRRPWAMSMGGPAKAYGTLPTVPVSRTLSTVWDETVEVDGATVSFEAVMLALQAFLRRWREEDEAAPPPEPLRPPTPAAPTPMPPPLVRPGGGSPE